MRCTPLAMTLPSKELRQNHLPLNGSFWPKAEVQLVTVCCRLQASGWQTTKGPASWPALARQRDVGVSGVRIGRPTVPITAGEHAVVVQHIAGGVRRLPRQPCVDRGEVRPGGCEQLIEAVDHEVGLLVGVDAVARAHHAFQAEAEAVW